MAARQVLVTNGGKQAVYQAFATLLDPGDEVLLPAPYWTTYPEAIALAGGVPVRGGHRRRERLPAPTVEQLEAARTDRTKVLLFCSPSNPTGAVYPPEQVEAIGRWAAEHGLWVITDEIYEHLVYDDAEHVSMPVVVPELADRCVVVNGVAKTYAMTGWRVGWLIGPPDVVQAATNLQSHLTSNVNNVAQRAALDRGDRRPDRGRRDAGRVRPPPADDPTGCSTRSTASTARSRRARSTPTRRSRGCSAGTSAAQRPSRRSSWPRSPWSEAEVAVVPGEAFGTPGLLPAVLRARRRRPGRGRQPAAEAVRRLSPDPHRGHPCGPALRATRARGQPAAQLGGLRQLHDRLRLGQHLGVGGGGGEADPDLPVRQQLLDHAADPDGRAGAVVRHHHHR